QVALRSRFRSCWHCCPSAAPAPRSRWAYARCAAGSAFYFPPAMPEPRFDLAAPAGARVAVAMSGGVDSSVCAALAREAGYEVVGVTLQLYDHGRAVGRKGACCAGADIHDARRVAEKLGVAHFVLDYEKRFRAA